MSFGGATVLSFESRRATEIAELIRNAGGAPLLAPALREVPLQENTQVFAFADHLYAGKYEMVILLTGVGTRLMGKVLETREPADVFQAALRRVAVVARGPKPTAVLREWKVPVSVSVAEPNTWRELLTALAGRTERTVAVQEYGRPNEPLLQGLRAQNREVEAIPVYQWHLPENVAPLASALQQLKADSIDVTLFTTGVQIDHFLEFAAREGQGEAAKAALRRTYIASVGPDCSEALRSHGIEPNFEPMHPKMGFLVREASQRFGEARVASDS